MGGWVGWGVGGGGGGDNNKDNGPHVMIIMISCIFIMAFTK